MRAYSTRLRQLGVKVFCGAEVRRLVLENGAFAEAELEDGRRIAARACVWAAHPATMVEAAPEGCLREPYRQRVLRLRSSASALLLFCASDAPLAELAGRNLLLWPGGGFSEKLRGHVPMRKNAIFLFAGQGGGESGRSVALIAPVAQSGFASWDESRSGNRPEAYRQEKASMLESLFAEMQRRVPNLAQRLVPVDGATPLTLRDWCLSPQGGMYGAAHSIGQINPQPLTRIPGVILCGQSIVAPGVLGAVVSAYLACGFLLGYETLHHQLQEIA